MNTPTPPEGYQLVTVEEMPLPVPEGTMCLLADDPRDHWSISSMVGCSNRSDFLIKGMFYAIPAPKDEPLSILGIKLVESAALPPDTAIFTDGTNHIKLIMKDEPPAPPDDNYTVVRCHDVPTPIPQETLVMRGGQWAPSDYRGDLERTNLCSTTWYAIPAPKDEPPAPPDGSYVVMQGKDVVGTLPPQTMFWYNHDPKHPCWNEVSPYRRPSSTVIPTAWYAIPKSALSKPDADGWIPHVPGDPCPCAPELHVKVKLGDGSESDGNGPARMWRWSKSTDNGGDIVAWRPHKPEAKADPYAELKVERAEPQTNEFQADYDTSIHSNPDARAWAKLFVDTCQKNSFHVGTSKGVMAFNEVESWMITWFANAMMAQHDYLLSKQTDPYAKLKTAHAAGKVIQAKNSRGEWQDLLGDPMWEHYTVEEFRIKPDEYAELKAAHAAGKVIQWYNGFGWEDRIDPLWVHPVKDYRIKPEADTPPVTASPLDTQVGGTHYKDYAIQPVEFVTKNGLGFCEGNAIKYICRHGQKNGAQDLDKAIRYLQILKSLKYGK